MIPYPDTSTIRNLSQTFIRYFRKTYLTVANGFKNDYVFNYNSYRDLQCCLWYIFIIQSNPSEKRIFVSNRKKTFFKQIRL